MMAERAASTQHRRRQRGAVLRLALLLVAAASAAAADWKTGDIFVGSQSRVHVIDGQTLKQKEVLKVPKDMCHGWITGAAFNADGTRLYLTCHHGGRMLVVDAATPGHSIVAAFSTGVRWPESVVMDSHGMLYVGSADSAVVAKHHANGTKLALLQVDGGPQHRAGWLALNKAETRLLSTSRSASLHQFDLVAKKPLTSAQAAPDDAACFALQPLPDGKGMLIACKTCVHRLGPNNAVVDSFCPVAAPDGSAAAAANSSAPAGEGPDAAAPGAAADEITGLKTLALDPSGTHFYVADSRTTRVYKVPLNDLSKPVATFAPEGTRKVHGLGVLRKVNSKALAAVKAAPPKAMQWPPVATKAAPPQKPATKQVQAQKPVDTKQAAAQKPVDTKQAAAQKPVDTKQAAAQKPVDTKQAPPLKPANKPQAPPQKPAAKQQAPPQKPADKPADKSADKPADKKQQQAPPQKPAAQKPAANKQAPPQKPADKHQAPKSSPSPAQQPKQQPAAPKKP